jgi:hypothetical protein
MILTTAPDVLLVVVVMFAAGTAASHLLFRKSPMARAIARVGFLILLTIALLYAGIAPYQPLQSTGVPWHDAAHAVLKIAWWLWMAWFLVGLVQGLLATSGVIAIILGLALQGNRSGFARERIDPGLGRCAADAKPGRTGGRLGGSLRSSNTGRARSHRCQIEAPHL